MTNSTRWLPVVVGLLALGAVGLLVGPGARAEEGAGTPKAPGTWVYDVRVVRVDPAESAVLEVAPPWQPAGAAGATTTATWADLLAGLKVRGRATILLDQRLTAIGGVPTGFRQERKRVVLTLQNRAGTTENWTSSYIETGAKGELSATSEGLRYELDVRWEERPTTDGTAPLGNASWQGSHSTFTAGETLVLSHRQQQVDGEGSSQGLEIYVFVTGWPVPTK